MEIKQNFLQELKETGIVKFQWVSTANNEVDVIKKNLAGPEHNHAARLCGCNKYYSTAQKEKNEMDMSTKNLAEPEHNKHAARFCRCKKNYSTAQYKENHQ